MRFMEINVFINKIKYQQIQGPAEGQQASILASLVQPCGEGITPTIIIIFFPNQAIWNFYG